jgi:molybdenum cofactor guanylyltransferase
LTALTASPLYGLILAGGKSRRMQRDKALLAYHGQNQVQRSATLLEPVCKAVFLSLQPDRQPADYGVSLGPIHDRFGDCGPLGGILSAQDAHPHAAWLVLACDLPFLNSVTLLHLVARRDPARMATAYSSFHDNLPEPLCAIYEPSAQPVLKRFLDAGRLCPRKILIEAGLPLLTLPDPRALDNVNTAEEFQEAMERLHES